VCALGSWVEPSVIEYDAKWFLIWTKRKDVVYNKSLLAYLKLHVVGSQRDAALESTLRLVAKNKMLNALGIHPDWVLPVLSGSIAMALNVGPLEKVARKMGKPIEKSSLRKNWILRNTQMPLERVTPVQARFDLTRVRLTPFVRKWFLNQSVEKSRIG